MTDPQCASETPIFDVDPVDALPEHVTVETAAIMEAAATFFAYGEVVRLLLGSDESIVADEVGRPAYALLVASGLLTGEPDGCLGPASGEPDTILEALWPTERFKVNTMLVRFVERAVNRLDVDHLASSEKTDDLRAGQRSE